MGLDLPALKHLEHCKKYGLFGETLTLGRQQVLIHSNLICNELNITGEYFGYCESLLIDYFGSTSVESVDNSNYENATFLWDMNKIIDSKTITKKYDTIIDFGTLEHVYHINNALYNVSKFCKPKGQIIHVLPSNQFCGHGFWQMSPELFFSLYSEKNGYEQTEIFMFDTIDTKSIIKLEPPSDGKRILINSNNPLYVAVRTVLSDNSFSHDDVQQSDYLYLWGNSK